MNKASKWERHRKIPFWWKQNNPNKSSWGVHCSQELYALTQNISRRLLFWLKKKKVDVLS